MKHIGLTALLFSLVCLSGKGQQADLLIEGPGFYFNKFQQHYASKPDSAYYFARLLAGNPKFHSMFQDLIHNSFAQNFIKRPKETTDPVKKAEQENYDKNVRALLMKMADDDNQSMRETTRPIVLWLNAQENENNVKQLAELSKEFVTKELSANDIYQNRVGRYALLIHQLTSKKEELRESSESLLNATTQKLKANQVQVNVDIADRPTLAKRSWYRYLYAYCNFIQAEARLKNGANKEAGFYFREASDYSPDITDRQRYSAYFYEMIFLFGDEKKTFQDDYINYLSNSSEEKQQILAALTKLSLTDPAYKEQLKSFYEKQFSDQEDFTGYWLKTINKQLKNSPAFSLKQINGTGFSKSANKGKWILIDFWGTWCVPCREEHPDLQKFYESISASAANDFKLLTVACNDTESKVNAYLAEYKYNFPVAMSDRKIEQDFHVNSYPHKVLITPQGKFTVIPFGTDWVDYIKKYTGL